MHVGDLALLGRISSATALGIAVGRRREVRGQRNGARRGLELRYIPGLRILDALPASRRMRRDEQE